MYYAFKQSVTEEEFYDNGDILKIEPQLVGNHVKCAFKCWFSVNGTWPMRSELGIDQQRKEQMLLLHQLSWFVGHVLIMLQQLPEKIF